MAQTIDFPVGQREAARFYQKESPPPRRGASSRCPFCHSRDFTQGVNGQVKCSSCSRPVVLLPAVVAGISLVVPAVYARHRAVCLAGAGGMGIVMYGIDQTSGEPVAIKLLPYVGRLRRKAVARFHREVEALRNVRHPNLVHLLAHGTIGIQRFLVMDWVEGPTFREVIEVFRERQEMPNFELVRSWLIQACAGLAAIHRAGVVHRDIKPSNLILETSGVVRIADFGIACLTAVAPAAKAGTESEPTAVLTDLWVRSPLGRPLTSAGEFTGTAGYVAPECLNAAFTATTVSDLYSLGVTFYEIATGKRPTIGSPPPSTLNASLPQACDRLIMRLLDSAPADRFASAEEVTNAICDIQV